METRWKRDSAQGDTRYHSLYARDLPPNCAVWPINRRSPIGLLVTSTPIFEQRKGDKSDRPYLVILVGYMGEG
jgi:hypothetical protein